MIGIQANVRSIRSILILVTLFAFATGCRSYGGDGSEEAIYNEIHRAHQQFEEELLRARSEVSMLEQAASENEQLTEFSEQYRRAVEGHAAVFEGHTDMIANLSPESDHRTLHRVFGALITKQRTVRLRYQGLMDEARYSFLPSPAADRVDRPYALIPPYYQRVQSNQRDVTLDDVLAAARAGGSQVGENTDPDLETPAAPTDTGTIMDGDAGADTGEEADTGEDTDAGAGADGDEMDE